MTYLDDAVERRREGLASLESAKTDCFRLVDGWADGLEGLVIEVFGPVAILQEHVGRFAGDEASLRDVAREVLARFPKVKSVYRKRFVADRTSTEDEALHRERTPFAGVPSEPVVVAVENGHCFRIRPYDGYSTGLFLDQRENRRAVTQALRAGSSALNLFAYTGGFSVYAAARGAATDTIDLSRRYLDWAKENFSANGLPTDGHRFFADNATVFLRRAVNRLKRYDLVVIDPPSFSRSKEGPFRVREHLPRMVEAATTLLASGGALFVSSNNEAWPPEEFEAEMERAVSGSDLERAPLPSAPFDFQGNPEPLRAAFWRLPR